MCNKHSGRALTGRRPMNQVPLARQELSSPFDGAFFFSPPPFLAFLCIFLLLSTFLFLSAVFSESWLPLQRIWEAALRDARNSARQACCYIPTGHPQVSMLPTLPGAVYIKERGADVTNPRNRLTCSRKEQG